MIAPHTRLVRSSHVVQASLGEGSVALMSLEQSSYFGLEEPASTIWELLGEERTFESLIKSLVDKFDVTYDDCVKDTSEFLTKLVERDLVRYTSPAP